VIVRARFRELEDSIEPRDASSVGARLLVPSTGSKLLLRLWYGRAMELQRALG
jgi:hypothetical protein